MTERFESRAGCQPLQGPHDWRPDPGGGEGMRCFACGVTEAEADRLECGCDGGCCG